MKLILLPAIAGMVVAHPALGQARAEPSTLKTVQSATRSATIEPATTGFVNGALVYPYSEGTIFQVYAMPGLVTDIALQPGENLVAVASGDKARWVIGRSEEHTSELQSIMRNQYAAFCMKKQNYTTLTPTRHLLSHH